MGISFSILCSALVAAASQPEIRSCADVLALVRQPPNDSLTVRLRGTVTYDKGPTIPVLSLEDATGALLLRCNDNPPLKAGMQIEVRAYVSPEGNLSTGASAVRITGRSSAPVPAAISGSDFSVVGQARNGEEAVAEALRLKPDVVIMDLMMPKMDGVEATAILHEKLPGTKILILTSFDAADGIALRKHLLKI